MSTQFQAAVLPQPATPVGGDVATNPAVKGIAMAGAAMFLYALMDAASKSLLGKFDGSQILLVRAVFAFGLGIGLAMARRDIIGSFVTRQPMMQAVRGFTGAGCMLCAMLALTTMPLAEVLTITYSAPIAATLLAIPMLGDKVGVRRLAAVCVGFVGVLMVARPDADGFGEGMPYAIAAMLLYAVSAVSTRRLGRTDSGLTIHLYTQVCFLMVCAPLAVMNWVTPDLAEASIIVCAAVAGAVAMYMLTLAHQSTPPAVVAPVDYTIILWGALFGLALWGEAPDLLSWTGIAIIAGTGLYIAQREFVTSPLNRTTPVYLWARRQRPA